MSNDNVRLIVKSANQETSATVIDCKVFWDVHQVKSHLAKVFPGKPPVEEQKIIYFGQLLEDSTKLKDVLRSTDDASTYTIHLVYTPKEEPPLFGPMVPNIPPELHFGLRQRRPEGPLPEISQNDQNHSVEIQNYLNNVMNYGRVPPYPPAMEAGLNRIPIAERFAHYHETYVHYMQQYARWYATNQNPAAPAAQNAANTEPAAAQAPAENQAGVAADNPDDPRDWLDWTYSISRAAILFMLIYFYSSPFRLLLVIIICLVLYMHKTGFLRQLGMQHNQQAQAQAQARPEQPAPENPQPAPENPQPAPENPQPAPNQQRDEGPQSILAVTWMIVISFFTSLIPETQ